MRAVHTLLLAVLALPAGAGTQPTRDPLDAPAAPTRLAASTQLSGVTQAGNRLVAVGIRGLIVTSDDGGATWSQRPAPVSSDLLAVHFPTPALGWAVGHDGVVLHSADGGVSWVKQFDGRQAAQQLTAHFKRLADGGDKVAARLLEDTRLNYENGPEQALLDVWFEDAQHGFVCGSFGTLFATSDGGKTWQSWVEKVEADNALHLNAIRGVGDDIYIASEKGIVFRLDRARQRFVRTDTGYAGSFFTLAGNGGIVLAGGLRGTAYRSADRGKTWQKLDTGTNASITGAAARHDRLMLVSQNGSLLVSDDAGASFRRLRVPRPSVLSGIVQSAPGKAVVVGANGVQQVALQ
jgi:photosystem II stability/assembly factor-like uncharacterized protein